jgi:multidrug efflux pump subunit AcrA (membrane-fusion protein)
VLDAYPEKRYRGEVKEIGRRINRAKATVPVKISFLDRPEIVLPEMAARVSILKEALDDKQLAAPPIRVVPKEAVVKRDGHDVVFVLDGEKVRMTTVTVGDEFGGGRRLDTDLLEGTKVVLRPPSDLSDGETVKEK